ncbi:DUF3291 domain-containing protein [Pseudomonas cremoricolorata]|uniref:DUF3291 domain-containing protein n=1 Tax=Pseudomonas cremoricolorata TaxID=157783 RepID=UPI0009DF82A3|nr:DUF3291 domain-containing protein [Pseudomonas cremoricolorata]
MSVMAQFDLVKPRYSRLDPRIAEFYAATEYVNGLAEAHPGFLWRETHDNQVLLDELFGEGYLYTLSVWRSPTALKDFLYRTPHNDFRVRGAEWFLPIDEPRVVMWWVDDHHTPDLIEAKQRLMQLRSVGPAADAFDLKSSHRWHISTDAELSKGKMETSEHLMRRP